MRTKAFQTALAAGLSLALSSGSARAAAMPDKNAVWIYMTFDETLDAAIPADGFRDVAFGCKTGAAPEFVPGKAGKALRVSKENGGALSVVPGLPDFPLARGSLVLWFRPEEELGRASRWLVFGNWASFEAHVEGNRLMSYATSNVRHYVIESPKSAANDWAKRWHMLVMTWDGPVRELFLDGRRRGRRDGVEPIKSAPYRLSFGFLPKPGKQPPTGFLDGALDEFAILKTALDANQVATLFAQGSKDGYTGLLASLGGAVLVQMDRHAYLRGEKAKLRVAPSGAGDAIRLSAVPAGGGEAVPLTTLPGQPSAFVLDTTDLRPGRYRIRAELLREGRVIVSDESARLAVRAEHRPEFPVGIDNALAYDDAMLERMEAWGLTHSANGGFYTTEGFYRDLDRLFAYGLSFFPCLNIHWQRALPLPNRDAYFDPKTGRGTDKLFDEVLQVLVEHGNMTFRRASTSLVSPLSPIGRRAMADRVRGVIEAARGHPGLQFIAFDDEYCLRVSTNAKTKKRLYGGYGKGARAYFKEKAGLPAAVFPPAARPGTVFPDDLPYFKWRDVVGMPGDATTACLALNDTELSELIHKLRPDILTTTWSGGEYGECDAVMDYTYPTIWQPHPGYQQGFGRLDYTMDRHRARQRVKPLKPLWGLLGWWSGDLRGKPDWCVEDFRLNTIMGLAKGVKLITWFTAYDPKKKPDQYGGGILSREDLRNEMIEWAGWIRRYGPMFARLEARPSGKVAVLVSEDNRVGSIVRQNMPTSFDWFYPCLRIAGIEADVITDEYVKDGRLMDDEALVLCGFDYASKTLWDRIQAFAATTGKTVFVDAASKLVPDGAIPLGLNAAGGHAPMKNRQWGMDIINETYDLFATRIRTVMLPRISPGRIKTTGSNFVAPHWLSGGEASLLCLVNYHAFKAQTVAASLRDVDSVLYDLNTGEVVAEGAAMQWRVEIPKGDAAWYLLLPRRIGKVKASPAITDGEFRIRASVCDADGRAFKAPMPIRIELYDPDGNEVACYERYTALDSATGVAVIAFPRAKRMDRAGEWRTVVTELVTGRTTRETVEVR